MYLAGDRRAPHDACGTAICPGDGQGDNDQQGREFVRMCDVGVLDIQSMPFCIGEQALDAPAFALEVEGAGTVIHTGGNDEQLTALDALRGEAQTVARRGLHALQPALP